jgi:methylenetetrahydrofolate--tRNA-(uracil-5-)-methyltransferase
MTGVEGYVESASSGLVAALSMANFLAEKPPIDFTAKTATGALGHYVSGYAGNDFQPMNITYGIMDPWPERIRNKAERYGKIAERALSIVDGIKTRI